MAVQNVSAEPRTPDAVAAAQNGTYACARELQASSAMAGMRHAGTHCLGTRALDPTHRRQPPFGVSFELSRVDGVARPACAPELHPRTAASSNTTMLTPDLRVRVLPCCGRVAELPATGTMINERYY